MGNMAKFTANLGTISVGEKNVKVVLALSKKDFFRHSAFFESDPEEVQVVLGDPQMSIEDYMRAEPPRGLKATVSSSGVVERVEGAEEGQDDLFSRSESEDTASAEGSELELDDDMELKFEEFEDGDSAGDESGEDAEEAGFTEAEEQAAVGSEEAGEEGTEEPRQEEEGAQEAQAAAEPTLKEIEAFVLAQKPIFPDINFDPELLQFKVDNDFTWVELGRERKTNSAKLQREWSEYKKRVVEMMTSNGAV